MHQHLLNHYDARIRDDKTNGDRKEQRGTPAGDGTRDLVSSASGGRDQGTRLIVLEKRDSDSRELSGDGVMVDKDHRRIKRHSAELSTSDAAAPSCFDSITHRESSMRLEGLRGGGGEELVAEQSW